MRPLHKGISPFFLTGTLWISLSLGVDAEPQPAAVAHESSPSTGSLLQMMDDATNEEQPVEAEALFIASCTPCHDTERATSKTKTLEGWRMTVRRMAWKPGANIPESDIEPIAEYLASLSAPAEAEGLVHEVPSIGEVMAASSVSANATISLLWRKGDAQVENQGFFPDIWVGGDWQPPDNPFSASVTACTSCHDFGDGLVLELVEGSFRADLIHLMTGESAAERTSDLRAEAKAGRFVVPFGTSAVMSHPGTYRTVTRSLMYNMGRRIGSYEPVLPMPYSDEGVNLHLGIPLPQGFSAQADGYAVNGLQDGGFIASRSYRDNNSDVALGGRIALGCSWMVIGGSYAQGELQAGDTPENNYYMAGGDVTLRYGDWIRCYYEYARRDEDLTPLFGARAAAGHVAEVEGKIWNKPKITLLFRYDTIRNSGGTGGATLERITWGPSISLPGGSLIIVNHEQWKHEEQQGLGNEDVIGIRWIAMF